jgi:hypothetical protein
MGYGLMCWQLAIIIIINVERMFLFFFRGLGFSTINIILLIVINHRHSSLHPLLVTFELGLFVD